MTKQEATEEWAKLDAKITNRYADDDWHLAVYERWYNGDPSASQAFTRPLAAHRSSTCVSCVLSTGGSFLSRFENGGDSPRQFRCGKGALALAARPRRPCHTPCRTGKTGILPVLPQTGGTHDPTARRVEGNAPCHAGVRRVAGPM